MAGQQRLAPRALWAVYGVLVCFIFSLGVFEVGLRLIGEVNAGHSATDSAERRLSDFETETRVAWMLCFWTWNIFSLLTLPLYWHLYIRETPNVHLPERASVPQELKGRFKYGLFDCLEEGRTFACFCCCTPCAVSDLWYRAGWLHAGLGRTAEGSDTHHQCPGWPFLAGAGLFQFGVECVPCFVPLVGSTLRGGIGWIKKESGGGLGNITPIRELFEIPNEGLKDFIIDALTWCFCTACAGTQEYRQVMDALNSGHAAQMPAQQHMLFAPAIGQPMQPIAQPVHAGVVPGVVVPAQPVHAGVVPAVVVPARATNELEPEPVLQAG
eukprot:CAMPEP_0115460842 /NCGR_PEP_ID=MMETSP0271-20121206/46998_1 /TAXON_ID=71861 /ORGANISM="Scrippsiella trochoidea, Strain CCMP3099" /LENGTH=325 /DNA_ID=CAMNT_0002887573 /DNA_START=49 /DNA_END=1022 /DNA_ORIENTATION=+